MSRCIVFANRLYVSRSQRVIKERVDFYIAIRVRVHLRYPAYDRVDNFCIGGIGLSHRNSSISEALATLMTDLKHRDRSYHLRDSHLLRSYLPCLWEVQC